MKDTFSNNKNNIKTKSSDFDFDYWCKLAKTNPDVFESSRKRVIDDYISNLKDEGSKERMQRLQWRVEMERKRSKNAMESAIRIYDMMWESVGKNFEAIQDLAEKFRPIEQGKEPTERQTAKVLKFKQAECTGTEG